MSQLNYFLFIQQQLWARCNHHLYHQWGNISVLSHGDLLYHWLPGYREIWWLYGGVGTFYFFETQTDFKFNRHENTWIDMTRSIIRNVKYTKIFKLSKYSSVENWHNLSGHGLIPCSVLFIGTSWHWQMHLTLLRTTSHLTAMIHPLLCSMPPHLPSSKVWGWVSATCKRSSARYESHGVMTKQHFCVWRTV